MELCRLAGMLPSQYWRVREEYGATAEEAHSFNLAHLEYDRWHENKANEQTIVPSPKKQPKKGEMWGAKYRTDHDIFSLYYRENGESEPIDPMVESMSVDDLMALAMGEELDLMED